MYRKLIPTGGERLSFRLLTKNSLLLIVSNIGGAALSFGISILIGRGLGKLELGSWTFLFAWVAIISLMCEFGINSLLTRDVSRSPEEANKLLVASLSVQIFFAGILGMVIWIFSPLLSINSETFNAMPAVITISFAGIVYGSFTAIFRSVQWIAPIVFSNILGLVVQLALSIFAIRLGGGLLHLIWIAALIDIAQLISVGILWWLKLSRSGGELRFSIDTSMVMVKHAVPFALAGIFAAIQMRSATMMVGYLRDTTELGLFGAASRWSESAKLIPNGIFGVLYPAFATKYGMDYYKRSVPIINVLAVGLVFTLCLFSGPILYFSYGAEYEQGSSILFLLGIGLLPSLLNGNIQSYLYAAGEEKYATKMRGLAACMQILTGLPLVYFYGVVGAALSLLFGEIAIWLPLRKRMRKIMNKPVERME